MNRIFAITILGLSLASCGSDTYVAPMCNCAYDEICVDDECKPFTRDIVPAPEQTEGTKP